MKNKLFIIFILTINILAFTNNQVTGQESTPTFQSLMLSGDKEFQNGQYIKAKTYYQEALRLKKGDATANSKLNKTLQKIREQGEKEEKFYEIIDIADNHYDNNEYEKALIEYNKAIKIFPKDTYTLERIRFINNFIKEEKDKLNNFNNLTSVADNLKSQGKYTEALSKYEEALKIYPTHASTKEKYQETKEKEEEFKKITSDFEALQKEGYELTLRKRYDEALEKYNSALKIFPNNTELKKTIESLKEKKETSEKYNTNINTADALYIEKSYEKAKEAYKQALTIVPNDAYSLDMISRINEITSNDNHNNTEHNQKKEESVTIQNVKVEEKPNETPSNTFTAEYKQYISNGDIQFNFKNYDKAIEFYTKALALNTGSTYPSEMINHIGNILQANKIEELVSNKLEIPSNTKKRFNFKPIDITTRKNNYIFIKAKNLSGNAFTLYVTYGSNNGRSGSFILRIPDNQNINDYIIRIGSQYKWFSEDNTWIELSPENGNLEIELMEITKGN